LAAGKRVFVVSPDWWSFSHHPNCRVFKSLEGAITAICAMRDGETARHETALRGENARRPVKTNGRSLAGHDHGRAVS
jgi:hypothetical protein